MFFNMQIDPVCKMKVSKNVEHKSVYNGKTYYFCALDCKETFDKDQKKYVK